MTQLVKATLQKIKANEAEEPDGPAFPVQFNPSSLRLKITNQIEGGRSSARQTRQQSGNSSRTLTLELHFDTADEGTTSSPVSVREKTKQLEQFVITPENNPDPPPKMKFQWGDLTIVGIAESVDVSLEHFASNGYPLRAKVNLTIKEQDPTLQFQPSNRDSSNAQPPGGETGEPGSGTNTGNNPKKKPGFGLGGLGLGLAGGLGIGFSAGAKVGFALGGETSAQFAARVGADPKAWRSLETDKKNGSALAAGMQIGFNTSINSSPGMAKTSGVNTKAGVKQQAVSALNLSVSSANADQTGKAMSSLGGVEASINAVKIAQSEQAVTQSIKAFGMSFSNSTSVTGADSAGTKAITRTPLIHDNAQTISPHNHKETLPKVDQRAVTFGSGVPLQPLFGVAEIQQNPKVYVTRAIATMGKSQSVPVSNNLYTPAWEALPKQNLDATSVQSQIKNSRSCSCKSKPCACGGSC